MTDTPTTPTREEETKAVVDGDWPEDFLDDNGQYLCPCYTCGRRFAGHKRRRVCKTCFTLARLQSALTASAAREKELGEECKALSRQIAELDGALVQGEAREKGLEEALRGHVEENGRLQQKIMERDAQVAVMGAFATRALDHIGDMLKGDEGEAFFQAEAFVRDIPQPRLPTRAQALLDVVEKAQALIEDMRGDYDVVAPSFSKYCDLRDALAKIGGNDAN